MNGPRIVGDKFGISVSWPSACCVFSPLSRNESARSRHAHTQTNIAQAGARTAHATHWTMSCVSSGFLRKHLAVSSAASAPAPPPPPRPRPRIVRHCRLRGLVRGDDAPPSRPRASFAATLPPPAPLLPPPAVSFAAPICTWGIARPHTGVSRSARLVRGGGVPAFAPRGTSPESSAAAARARQSPPARGSRGAAAGTPNSRKMRRRHHKKRNSA